MKKIINRPEDVVLEMCHGLVLAHPELELLKKYKVIKRKQLQTDKVTLISGGGSGHEPSHAGFVGEGMLDAAVCGDMFASPSQIQVYQAIKETAGEKGTLLIIKNYSGDIMNFKNAAHLAKEDGLEVDYVKVDDDIAVEDSLYTVGRRGVAGVVLVHKVAGAASAAGRDLQQVKAVAEKAVSRTRSIGVALTSCTLPGGEPTFKLADDEMEYGVGIHGEPGIRREKVLSADELAKRMVEDLLKEGQPEEDAALLINGFGGTPLQELYLFNQSVNRELAERNIKINRIFVGNYMTSIDMAGVSVTIMSLDDELRTLLSSQSNTPAFKIDGPIEQPAFSEFKETVDNADVSYQVETDSSYAQVKEDSISLENIIYLVDKMSEIIIENESAFNKLDTHAGDGDFGNSVAKGFRQLKREWKQIIGQDDLTIAGFLDASSMVIMEHCGGASGPIWGGAFRAAGKAAEGKQELSVAEYAELLQRVVSAIQDIGERSFGRGAEVGDKTLIDALAPCADSWNQSAAASENVQTAFKKGAEAAVTGAEKTKEIVARMGRAGTVGERSLGYPDAGAHALGVIFTKLADSLRG
ncbi:dihydroxyacetone kinase subunit DhaK [Terribacillus saccharophilus]|uniref:Dihydroxyacetone kinase subunit DhaK n=1 Tax=Terribacillus saccharophilus TaxID=361277 RepID=A0ABX4GWG7_9BACI|nr:dihydroxyacetone kinase subunit DhaK [Terribacillus saccharophilus]PAD34891.1 dihydroxyacetone kinase subunit DhaK [Terribacillus saccharophilus]PAD95640.1 dihydroxyacetone kinase subunit DhaK [Terribacillus saccharophilus]PAD99217.1 dihydroxyacetone kinase subunit DhaK [Terribacillus saccharophilus]